MIATTARAGSPPLELRKWWWRHPEAPVVAVVAVAWVWLAVDHWANHSSDAGWRFDTFGWAAMVVAMMVPAAVPMYRLVAFDSLWRRRHRSALLFVATYAAVWTLAAVGVALVIRAVEAVFAVRFAPGSAVVVVALAAAGAWQFTDRKRRYLRRCHKRTPLASSGRKADVAAMRYGVFHARACIGSCAPAMAAMFVSVHSFHLMVPLALVLSVERLQQKPDPRLGGLALGVLAVVTPIAGL